ncbi:hypothetical protein VMCG_08248 [Cytospora schulzeri]|uniref:C3H1-type domain-containing protein n=1 Tax=Cytospora schulzeri TaxID=448051 RepID=A0A423VSX8_9PEZI|nr:hypothetical protein VMCG_08248 [Valsa malicola]
MLSDKDIDAAAQQLADYRKNDALSDILTKFENLLGDYKRLRSDYEEEREARERWKQQARGQERKPFVLVLVDADGYVFRDDLISAGPDGGTQAAQLLNESIKTSLRRKGLEHCELVIRVYANVAGLSKALSKVGLIGADKRSLAPFIANFNRTYSLTDFVDAGETKENADFKLRGLLSFYAENMQCKHIYFAACHDSGYVSELMKYRGHHDRFTLIRTSGLLFHDEFTKLGLGIEELPGVFRSTGSAMDAVYPKPLQSIVKSTAPTGPASPSGRCKYGDSCRGLHINTPESTFPVRSSKLGRAWKNGNDSNDALDHPTPTKVYGASNRSYLQNVDLFSQLPRAEDIPDGHVAVNFNQKRLDPYLPPPTSESESRLRSQSAKQRFCNSKHLSGSCVNPNCEYDHGHLDEDLKPVLLWLARSLPCPKRERCRNAACFYGHICQKPDCKFRGGKAFCRIQPFLHFDDLAVDRYVPALFSRQSVGAPGQSPSSTMSDEEEEEDATSPAGGISVNDS